MPNFAGFQNDIADIADRVYEREGGFESARDRQILVVCEETGEVVKAYRRITGRSRHYSNLESLKAEIADVVISAYVFAKLLGIDLDSAVAHKLVVIEERGGL